MISSVKKTILNAATLKELYPSDQRVLAFIQKTRESIHHILHHKDHRLLVLVGPCSIHDVASAKDYAHRLADLQKQYQESLLLVMRVYFEKPRTRLGWKGFINDPDLNGQFQLEKGLQLARQLLLDINRMGVPTATEFLDLLTPYYLSDLISWGAIGARTVESQLHREFASGLSCPIGFKNRTDGYIRPAIDAVECSMHSHHFLGMNENGQTALIETKGNADAHVVLRGGVSPNYERTSVRTVSASLKALGLTSRLIVDASHGNSQKQYQNQKTVIQDVIQQLKSGEEAIAGVMIESHLKEGRQDYCMGQPLVYGQSITDACIGWEETVLLLDQLATAALSTTL
ncbi:MAG: 3-deoxy-7-phosphoheptulonate synthase [Alcaligenaceae bacterium]|nr:3-deoxy-7-phosphoheptulonate synthase [Alcaligenaceae bacterium]